MYQNHLSRLNSTEVCRAVHFEPDSDKMVTYLFNIHKDSVSLLRCVGRVLKEAILLKFQAQKVSGSAPIEEPELDLLLSFEASHPEVWVKPFCQ